MIELDHVSGNYRSRLPSSVSADTKYAASACLRVIDEQFPPVDSKWLAGAVHTLLLHYYVQSLPDSQMQALAKDWVGALKEFPQCAVEHARSQWLKTSDKKPKPANIVSLCQDYIGKYSALKRVCNAVMALPTRRDEAAQTEDEIAAGKDRVREMFANLRQDLAG